LNEFSGFQDLAFGFVVPGFGPSAWKRVPVTSRFGSECGLDELRSLIWLLEIGEEAVEASDSVVLFLFYGEGSDTLYMCMSPTPVTL